MPETECLAWVLMEPMVPPITKNYFIHPQRINPARLIRYFNWVNDFSHMNYFFNFSDKDWISYNGAWGYFMRTKLAEINEVSILAGFAAFDSPYLYDD